MSQLGRISHLLTLLGIIVVVAAALFGWGAVWILAGLLLAWAGVVKIVVVAIWQRVARIDQPDRIPGDDV